jgi:hypothetical protein
MAAAHQARAQAPSAVAVTMVTGTVVKIHHTHANITLNTGKACIHATEVLDLDPSLFEEVRPAVRP